MGDGLTMKYFVLKPHGVDDYAAASRKAMEAYAMAISKSNPLLALDLLKWVEREKVEAATLTAQPEGRK